MKTLNTIRAGATVLLTLTVLAGCRREAIEAPPSIEPKVDAEHARVEFQTNAPQLAFIAVQPAQVRTTAVSRATGRLYWDEDRTVGVFTPVAGRVTAVKADLGQCVVAGTPLAEIDSPDFAQALADARTAVGNLAAADKAYDRSTNLLAHGAAAEKDVEAAQAADVAAAAEKDRAEARLANYGGRDTTSNALYLLRSPIAGIVVDKNISLGQELRADLMLANAPNLFAPSFVVSDPSRLWLQLDIAESDLGAVRPGDRLQILSSAYPGKVFDGEVDQIGAALDPSTRTVKVRGVVNNPDGLLKAEMYVQVNVLAAPVAGADLGVEIPSRALFMKGDDSYVFVETSPGLFERKLVKVGVEKDETVPVIEGLSPGQKVVVQGALLLQALVEPST